MYEFSTQIPQNLDDRDGMDDLYRSIVLEWYVASSLASEDEFRGYFLLELCKRREVRLNVKPNRKKRKRCEHELSVTIPCIAIA